uniref:histidine kinase n=1 Tax=Octactis speculum TaxID=3111310 RepID=A0A7S2CNW1_9STRA
MACACCLMVITGFVASTESYLPPGASLWRKVIQCGFALILSQGCLSYVSFYLYRLIFPPEGIHKGPCSELPFIDAKRFGMATICAWHLFPVVWVLAALQLVTVEQESMLYTLCDTYAKVMCTTVVVHGAEATYEQRNVRKLALEKWHASRLLQQESQFVSHVFHQVRNPYNGIVGHINCATSLLDDAANLNDAQILEWLAEQEPLEAIRNDINMAKGCAKHMNQILNNLLDLKKTEEGKMVLVLDRTDLNALCFDAVAACQCERTEEFESEVRVMYSLATTTTATEERRRREGVSAQQQQQRTRVPLIVLADSVRIRQILNNLLHDTIQRMVNGVIQLQLTQLRSEKDDEVVVRFEIRDKSDASVNGGQRNVHPSELGLVVAQHLVRLHGGEIRVDDDDPKCVVYFTLTFKAVVADSPAINGTRARPVSHVIGAHGGLTSNTYFLCDNPDKRGGPDSTDPRGESWAADDTALKGALPRDLRCLLVTNAMDQSENCQNLADHLTTMEPFKGLGWQVLRGGVTEARHMLSRHSDTSYDMIIMDERVSREDRDLSSASSSSASSSSSRRHRAPHYDHDDDDVDGATAAATVERTEKETKPTEEGRMGPDTPVVIMASEKMMRGIMAASTAPVPKEYDGAGPSSLPTAATAVAERSQLEEEQQHVMVMAQALRSLAREVVEGFNERKRKATTTVPPFTQSEKWRPKSKRHRVK